MYLIFGLPYGHSIALKTTSRDHHMYARYFQTHSFQLVSREQIQMMAEFQCSSLADCDLFSDISDGEFVAATQLIETISSNNSHFAMPDFLDISDEELVRASANVDIAGVDVVSTDSQHVDKIEFSDISDEEFIKLPVDSESWTKSRFRKPVSLDEMEGIVGEKFAKKTVDQAVWAVTLFGQWRADRNIRCLTDKSLVYINKPFALMTDDELIYTVPLFITEVLKKDGTEFPPATLRQLVLSLQKFLETEGRIVKFLSDDRFMKIRDTLDGVMKQRSRQGIGMEKKQAQASTLRYYSNEVVIIIYAI